MELGTLASDIASVVVTVAVAMLVMFFVLVAFVYVYARKTGRWLRNTFHHQLVNIAPGPGRDLVRMRARLENAVRGARGAVNAATAEGVASCDLDLLFARLEGAATRLDAQLEQIAAAKLRPDMLKTVLAPLRPRIDKVEHIATSLATIASLAMASGTEVELDLIDDRVGGELHFVQARTDALQQLRTN